MSKLFSAIPFLLMSCWALAAKLEEGAASAPAETVSLVYVALFLILFIGMIVGFFIYMWYLEKQKKAKGDQ